MEEKKTSVWAWLGGIVGSVIATMIIVAFWAFVVQYFWNNIMPDFGLPALNFWQASWLLYLLLIVFFLPLSYFVKVGIEMATQKLFDKSKLEITSNYNVDEIWEGADFGHEVGDIAEEENNGARNFWEG